MESKAGTVRASFEIEGAPDELEVRALRGAEGLSELYRFELVLGASSPSFDFGALLGKFARIALRAGSHERFFHGIVSRFEQPPETAAQGVYEAEIVPRAALLDMTSSGRALSGVTVPEVLRRALDEQGIDDVRFDLAGSYARRDVSAKPGETDWAFLSRLMKAEGIRYFFEHDADRHVLVLTDRETGHEALDGGAALPFRPEGGAPGLQEGVTSFGLSLRLRAPHRVGSGRASSLRLMAGRVFTLTEHPREEYDASYLLTRVEHAYSGEAGDLSATFTCVAVDPPEHAERLTVAPRSSRAPSAIVVSPAGVPVPTGVVAFDCVPGEERLELRIPRDLRVEVPNNAERLVGQDEALSVARHRSISVDGNNMLSVTGDDIVEVGGSQSVQIVGDRTIAVDGDHSLQVAGAALRQIVGDYSETLEGASQISVLGSEKRSIRGDATHVYERGRQTSIAGHDTASVTGNRVESVSGNHQLSVSGAATELFGSLQTSVAGDFALRSEGELRVESSSIAKVGALRVYIAAGATLTLRGRELILLEVGDTRLTIEEGRVTVSAGGVTKTLVGDES